MSYNKINTMEANELANLTNLKVLDLTGNLLERIDDTVFPALENLERLKLSENLIERVYAGSFSKLTALKFL